MEFAWESVGGTLSVTFRSSFGLPICFLISFNLEVTWNPSNGDTKVAESLHVSWAFDWVARIEA
ncbi:hypothetical protein PILCRDRAFT_12142 [Piloderma croceum F 1598]|uniref:Uncharacterized protein n=1 Tax=Piloderma croceum (strain F 1598) TaxID=765440 RepID=A0A0C3FBS4_PILCF|nr:hypothetical protein PILCRDRAFT_12142 [Piloderma croceum F 1598]